MITLRIVLGRRIPIGEFFSCSRSYDLSHVGELGGAKPPEGVNAKKEGVIRENEG